MVCANVDLYPGLVYKMMGIPQSRIRSLFAVARMVGLVRPPHRGGLQPRQ